MMEGMCSSETSIDFHRVTRRYIPQDITPLNWMKSSKINDRRLRRIKACALNMATFTIERLCFSVGFLHVAVVNAGNMLYVSHLISDSVVCSSSIISI